METRGEREGEWVGATDKYIYNICVYMLYAYIYSRAWRGEPSRPAVRTGVRVYPQAARRPTVRQAGSRFTAMDGWKYKLCMLERWTLERWNLERALTTTTAPGRAARRLASLLPLLSPSRISGLNPTRRSHSHRRPASPLSITSTASHNRFRVTTLNRSTPINTFLTSFFQRACLDLPLS